jgi:hypothetical protein
MWNKPNGGLLDVSVPSAVADAQITGVPFSVLNSGLPSDAPVHVLVVLAGKFSGNSSAKAELDTAASIANTAKSARPNSVKRLIENTFPYAW